MHLPLKHSVILPDHPLWKWKPLAESRPWTLRLGKDQHQARSSAWKARCRSRRGR